METFLRLLFFFILLCPTNIIYSQPTPILTIETDTARANYLLVTAEALSNEGQYAEALSKADTARNILENALGFQSLEVANALNKMGNYEYFISNYPNALHHYQKAMDIRISLLGEQHSKVGDSKINVGNLFYTIGNFEQATKFTQSGLYIYRQTLDKNHPNIASAYNNIGNIFMAKGAYDKAIQYFNKSLNIRLKKFGKISPLTGMSANNLGGAYKAKGDYDQAVQYYEKALSIFSQILGTEHPYLSAVYSNIGTTYYEKQDYERAIDFQQKALHIRKQSYGEVHPEVAISAYNLAGVFFYKDDFDQALIYYQNALDIWLANFDQNHPYIANTYNNIGLTHNAQGDTQQAISYYYRALDASTHIFGDIHPEVALSYNHLADIQMVSHHFTQATKFYQNALKANNFDKASPSTALSSEVLLSTFAGLMKNFNNQYIETKHSKILIESHTYSQLAFDFINYQLSNFKRGQTLINWQKKYIPLFEQMIVTSLSLSKEQNDALFTSKSFIYSEKNKSSLLQSQIQESNALHYANIPDSLLEKEYDLRIDITYYDKKRQEKLSEGLEETDTMILAISSKLFDLNQAYDNLKTHFENEYPDYYKLKYDLSTVSVEEVQSEILKEDQALLEYFVGDSSIFIFRIEKENYQVYEVKRDFPLEQWTEELRNNISKPHTTNHERYTKVAQQLYTKIFSPVAEGLPEKLIIIPDGILGYLPFEALLTDTPDNIYKAQQLPYLLRKHQISYSYSATLLKEMQQKKHLQQPTRELLALAPFVDSDTILTSHLNHGDWIASLRSDTLVGLPYSKVELDSLQQIFPTDAFYGNTATEEVFAEHASNYQILHLSTHGKADARIGDYSYLAFFPQADSLENEMLYVRDLYNLSLNADLVTLSACETGIGELQRGEGIISLARAFAYAGAKSITTTLWQVNDRSTQKLVVNFYRYLRNGLPKDEALHRAKLDYISNHSGSQAYPFFWAAFIGIGDMSPLK